MKHMSTSIIKSADDLDQISQVFAQSGFFADAKDAAQCAVKIMAGMESGIGAFSAHPHHKGQACNGS